MLHLTYRLAALATLAVAFTASLTAQTAPAAPKLEFPAPSPAATVKQRVGITDIEINYARPGAKGRAVFGGLVPYGKVWRTGANTATKIKFSTAVNFGGTAIPAGTYELFSIPGEKEWTVIVHKDSSQWGAYAYDSKNDIARITAKTVSLATPIESLTIDLNDFRDESASLSIAWEKTRVSVKLTVDVVATLVPQIEAVMASDAAKKPYMNAAIFYLDNKLDLKKAAQWMDAAIAAQPDAFYLFYRKGLILAAAGDKAGARAAAEASLAAAQKAKGPIGEEYTGLNQKFLASLK
ncbi:MAG: DUF2911 domain-containing protein [Undibacterium sp.]|nr:DUF2911 domain-containing protein [Opitutaceae bacterium]